MLKKKSDRKEVLKLLDLKADSNSLNEIKKGKLGIEDFTAMRNLVE